MLQSAIQASIVGVGVTLGLWLLWARVGQPRGLRRVALALLSGAFTAGASFVISAAIASV